MKANSEKTKQSKKATRRVLAGVLCGASVLSLVLSLVMPPISQAIANDAQTVPTEATVADASALGEDAGADENVLGEETSAGNSTGKDAENQNSNDAEGDETSGDAATVGLSSDDAVAKSAEQPADDGANDENDVMPTAADGFTELNQNNIHNQFGEDGTPGSYRLTENLEYAGTITLNHGETVIDLNGHKIIHTSENQSLFNITGGATLTVMDSQQAPVDNPIASDFACSDSTLSKNANLASVVYDETSKIPDKLIYYVTGSSVNEDGTSTTEALYRHEVTIGGAIVARNSSNRVSLINLNGEGCTFNLQSGVLTQEENRNVGHLIHAENRSIVKMSGGYVCGASVGRDGAGAGIAVIGNSTLKISDGVIAGNYAPSGGGVYAMNSTVNMVGGIISGNGTNQDQRGYGAGICAENSSVTITNGYITNNKYQFYQNTDSTGWKHLGNGCHGGGGIAAFSQSEGQKIGSLVISGGYITGNYSAEAGGGIYAGAWNRALSGFTFSGGIIASNVAQNSEGGGIRIAAPTVGEFNVSGTKAYITNNTTNTTNDWGGGGVFVQGSSDQGIKSASLYIYNALITNNHANGFGGGFAACPTGQTAITDTNGIAIYGNSDGRPDGRGYNRSGGTHEKTDDKDWRPNHEGGEITEDFKKAGHQDLFLIRDSANAESLPYIAAVTGQMLGGGAANWSGTIDNTPTSIGKYEGAQAKYMIGLKSEPIQEDKDAATAAASLFITGNRSNIHGGGIMTNGDVIAGSTTEVNVYPKMKLKGTKALEGRALTADDAGKFRFQLLDPGESGGVPSFNNNDDGKLQLNGCSIVGDDDGATNDAEGNFVFDLGRVHSAGMNVYYLVEDPGNVADRVPGVDYDQTIYKIELTTKTEKRPVLKIDYFYYLVTNVRVTNLKNNEVKTFTPNNGSDVSIKITDGNTDKTFTNAYKPKGSWTPRVTKRVDGGEMKKFEFELFTKDSDGREKSLQTKRTSAESGNPQIVTFDPVPIGPLGVKDLTGGKATFTYFIRECGANKTKGTKHEGYKNDTKTFKVVVTATDNGDGTLNCTPTYYEVDASGHESATPTTDPTFTNTYSTSLPLSGMSGVTLTYLAGAAVLCAAAAWMHIRRKANAKGGKRRE